MNINEKAKIIQNYLDKNFDNSVCELNFDSNFQLAVAVILSAQCTDKRVNVVTKNLFKICPTPKELNEISIEELEKIIYSCGFYHNKAKNLKLLAKDLVEKYNNVLPSTFEELVSLGGIGRKTANVILSTAFNQDAIAVDTHVQRLANRLGICKTNKTIDTERALQKVFPKQDWSKVHYELVLMGRYHCKSRNPNCNQCELKSICSFNKKLCKK